MGNSNETKLKFYGLIKAAAEQQTEIEYSAVSQMLETPPATLRKWFKEFKEQAKTDSVLKLIDLDTIVLDTILDTAEAELGEVDELDSVRINPVTGVIEVVTPEEAEAKQSVAEVKKFREGVTGLKLLREELQAAAGSVVMKVALATQGEEELTAKELASLASALTSVQNAFFNKPTTNVQVNSIYANTDEEGATTLLSAFKGGLKS